MRVVFWLVALAVALAAIDVAVSNFDKVQLALWPFSDVLVMPLYLVVLGALGLGFIAGELVAWINGGRWRREARRRQRRIDSLERELQATQARLPPLGAGGVPAAPHRD